MRKGRTLALGAVAAAIVALPLAADQFVSSIAMRAQASPGSWAAALPPEFAERIERGAARASLPGALRLVLARRALAEGDEPRLEGLLAALPPSGDRSALEGALAERRGYLERAISAYIAANDVDDVERVVAGLARRGKLEQALLEQRTLIVQLRRDAEHTGSLPEAYYRLGMLEKSALSGQPGNGRANARRRALLHVRQAIELAPLASRYWIEAGKQELDLDELAAAGGFFRKALELNAHSTDAFFGLATIAARRGALDEARSLLENARSIDPKAAALERLRLALP